MEKKRCKACGAALEGADTARPGACRWCARKAEAAAFAAECGLRRYPDPTGERYVFRLDGTCDGKKGECVELMDELWDALARAKGRPDLALGKG